VNPDVWLNAARARIHLRYWGVELFESPFGGGELIEDAWRWTRVILSSADRSLSSVLFWKFLLFFAFRALLLALWNSSISWLSIWVFALLAHFNTSYLSFQGRISRILIFFINGHCSTFPWLYLLSHWQIFKPGIIHCIFARHWTMKIRFSRPARPDPDGLKSPSRFPNSTKWVLEFKISLKKPSRFWITDWHLQFQMIGVVEMISEWHDNGPSDQANGDVKPKLAAQNNITLWRVQLIGRHRMLHFNRQNVERRNHWLYESFGCRQSSQR
jgi:hypothetical protein